MTRRDKTFCGEFYSSDKGGECIGNVHKVNGGFVIRGIEAFSGRTLWESAPLSGKSFRRFDTMNLGYAKVTLYTAR
jgi:hypothetical protein